MDINSLSLYHQPLGGFKAGELVIICTPMSASKSVFWDIEATDGIWKDVKVKEPKYKFSRAKWYSANLRTDVLWRLGNEYNEMIEWCTQHFGKHPKRHDAWSRWWVGVDDINFRDAKDYEWYVLRWS